jgi:hypothetical protein
VLGKHLNKTTTPAEAEAAMTYVGRPITLALAVALSISTAPVATPRNLAAVATQAPAASGTTAKSAILSSDTTVVARLLTNINAANCKAGDGVEAELTREVSQNHKVVLKRGTRVFGHVAAVSAFSTAKPETRLAIFFDSVSLKGGGHAQISFVIQALAREPDLQAQLDLQDGRGSAATVITAANSGGSIGGPLAGGLLRPEDSGVYGIPGLSLALMTANKGPQTIILVSASENIRLAKGTQMVLRVVQN